MKYENDGNNALESWFEMSRARYLTVPRLVLNSMPHKWQGKLAALMEELDETLDWRPKEGRYWVKLKDDRGRYAEPPHEDYRHGQRLTPRKA